MRSIEAKVQPKGDAIKTPIPEIKMRSAIRYLNFTLTILNEDIQSAAFRIKEFPIPLGIEILSGLGSPT
jgi:hypothetical protein